MEIRLNDLEVRFEGKLIYCDTETNGLYGDVMTLQVYSPDTFDGVYVFTIGEYPLVLMKKRLSEAETTVWHNGSYDFNCLGWLPEDRSRYEDTFILDTLVNYRMDKHSLDDVMIRCYKADKYAGFNKREMQKSDWSGSLSEAQMLYAATDVYYLKDVYLGLHKELQAEWEYDLDKATVINFCKMGQRLPIDVEGLKAHKVENNKKIRALDLPINVNSYQQVRPYISGLPKDEAIATVGSDDDALALACSKGNEKACNVRTSRSLKKQISFINKFLAEKMDEDYIQGRLNVGTRSGRSKCASQNLQQVPQAFKQYIKSRKYMVYSDYAQLELRSLCALIGEEVFERLFREKADLHDFVKESLFGTDDTQKVSDAGRGNSLRQIAKIYSFASLYGAGWATIGGVLMKYTGISLSEAELKANKKKWLSTFPGVKVWHDQNIRHWQAKRPLTCVMGRQYVGKLPTDTNNIINQNLGATVAKLAMVYMSREMDLSKFLIFVHDSWTAEYDTLEEAKQAAEIMANCMSRAWFDVTANCKIKDLPMPVEAYVQWEGSWKTVDGDSDDVHAYVLDSHNGIASWK
ncbi:MAG: hypothetical protein DRN33_05845 [Thermoplasmata archaeon]|nr:MAG: hypothetical protein DRN33_05845 [Thermoplasmata archaeon]